MINHPKFIHLMRSYELKKLAETKLNKQTGIIIEIFLDDQRFLDKSFEHGCSESMSFSQIFNKLKTIWELNDKKTKGLQISSHLLKAKQF